MFLKRNISLLYDKRESGVGWWCPAQPHRYTRCHFSLSSAIGNVSVPFWGGHIAHILVDEVQRPWSHIQEWAGLVKQSTRRWGISWCGSNDSSMELTWTQIFATCKPWFSKDQSQRILTSINFYCWWWLDAIILKILTSLARRRKLSTMDLSVSLINKQNRQSKMDTLEHTRCHIHDHILYTRCKFYLQGK